MDNPVRLLNYHPKPWVEQAKCKHPNGIDFYPDKQDLGPSEFARRVRAAKAYCADCPVKQECLETALEIRDPGIWGGTTPTERARMYGAKPLRFDYPIRRKGQ